MGTFLNPKDFFITNDYPFKKIVAPLISKFKVSKWKSLRYLLQRKKLSLLIPWCKKNPLQTFAILLRFFSKNSKPLHQGIFFFYDLQSLDQWEILLKDSKTLLFIGLPYCLKPLHCPSIRFSDRCNPLLEHLACKECFFQRCKNMANPSVFFYIITDVHHLAEKFLEILSHFPKKKVIFFITSCEFSLHFFHPWAFALSLQGLTLPLQGSVCSNFPAFSLAERGIKTTSTSLPKESEEYILSLFKNKN